MALPLPEERPLGPFSDDFAVESHQLTPPVLAVDEDAIMLVDVMTMLPFEPGVSELMMMMKMGSKLVALLPGEAEVMTTRMSVLWLLVCDCLSNEEGHFPFGVPLLMPVQPLLSH